MKDKHQEKKCPGKMMKVTRNPGGGPRSPSLTLFADIRQLPRDWSPCPPVCTLAATSSSGVGSSTSTAMWGSRISPHIAFTHISAGFSLSVY